MPTRKKLDIKMLGRFSLQYAGREIVLDRNIMSKTTQLLQILVLNHKEGVSKAALVDALYGREHVENKNASLNNTIFRMRKQLKAQGLPESSYVIIKGGMCYWDEARIPVKMDVTEFEEAIAAARLEADPEKQMQFFAQACEVYSGEFLPEMIAEEWVAVRSAQYRDMYRYCVNEICYYYTETERYEKVIRFAHWATEIYPTEEWQLWEIDSYVAIGRYEDAMKVYQHMAKVMMDELGLTPTPEMLERFRVIGGRMTQDAGAIETIKRKLQEKGFETGAYYCTFPSFVDIYHVISRIIERNGVPVCVMLCSLKDKTGRLCAENSKQDRKISQLLQRAIGLSLNRGDFYTRYNYSQYLAVMVEICKADCAVVSEKIRKAFRELHPKEDYKVDFYVVTMGETGG